MDTEKIIEDLIKVAKHDTNYSEFGVDEHICGIAAKRLKEYLIIIQGQHEIMLVANEALRKALKGEQDEN